jgi:hypothetical protein
MAKDRQTYTVHLKPMLGCAVPLGGQAGCTRRGPRDSNLRIPPVALHCCRLLRGEQSESSNQSSYLRLPVAF